MVINEMLIRLSVKTALEVYIWSNFNISTVSAGTKHETLLGIITFLLPLFWNLRKLDERNKDSKVYWFLFLTPIYKLHEDSKKSYLAPYCDGKYFNTPKMRHSNITQTRLNNSKAIKRRQLLLWLSCLQCISDMSMVESKHFWDDFFRWLEFWLSAVQCLL